MNTKQTSTDQSHPDGVAYALRREAGCWRVTFQGRQGVFTHEIGALYVACLLSEPPREPIHAVALALNAREKFGGTDGGPLPTDLVAASRQSAADVADPRQRRSAETTLRPRSWSGCAAEPDELFHQRVMGLEDAAAVRALWQRQRELERVLQDGREPEPAKAEAQRELEEITEHLRQSPWLSRHGAERCARAVGVAIMHLHARLATAVDAQGRPDEVLRAFALHLHEHLLVPSGRGGRWARKLAGPGAGGCFMYVPPKGPKWNVECGVRSAECGVRGARGEGRGADARLKAKGLSLKSKTGPAAADYLSRFLCAGLVLALLGTGCAGSRPLRGGKAVLSRKPTGMVEQTLVQGENPAQATRQDQESIKVRTYTMPAGSRMESSPTPTGSGQECPRSHPQPPPLAPQPSALNSQPSTSYVLSAPMPVVEREETRARTELGAAQKDTARELGAKLASLKGIVWVGVGLFVFGLASLVWPPLKAIIGSVTTSAAMMLGGVALMVLPTMVVGNELLILGVVALAVGGWFLAHRHGQLSGMVAGLRNGQSPMADGKGESQPGSQKP